jgi:hypothetical protein
LELDILGKSVLQSGRGIGHLHFAGKLQHDRTFRRSLLGFADLPEFAADLFGGCQRSTTPGPSSAAQCPLLGGMSGGVEPMSGYGGQSAEDGELQSRRTTVQGKLLRPGQVGSGDAG